ncbi:polysaccharide deacetylase family protein [Candidatus Woesearchaeota archaeon]|nr:polysaccharide deacetylase family protein [Candidatus Woesearchaeota archaeon]
MAIAIALHKVHKHPDFYDTEVGNVISEKKLKEIISTTSEKYEFLELPKFLNALQTRKDIALLTFDDGNSSVFTNAFPILKSRKIPFAIFINTHNIHTQKPHWFEVIESAFLSSSESTIKINNMIYQLNKTKERISAVLHAKEGIKKNQYTTKSILQKLKISRTVAINDAQQSDPQLNKEQINILKKYRVTIGAHAEKHVLLSMLSKEDQKRNIFHSKNWIEKNLHSSCFAFSYPNGQTSDFTEYTKHILRVAGFSCAFSAIGKKINRQSDKYSLPRYFVWEDRYLDFISSKV